MASRTLSDPAFLEIAERAAWNAWESEDGYPDLCCGLAGRAYSLLNLYQHDAGEVWLHRAITLVRRALEAAPRLSAPRNSLYKGELGVALLACDIERPDGACMPFFASEGWPAPLVERHS